MDANTVEKQPDAVPVRRADGAVHGLDHVRELLLQPSLRRAVASGSRRGSVPRWRRAEVRPVDLARGPHLQVTTYADTQAYARNSRAGESTLVDELLAEPFASWHVESDDPAGMRTTRWRVTRKGRIESSSQVAPASQQPAREQTTDGDRNPDSNPGRAHDCAHDCGPAGHADRAHDRPKRRLLDPAAPVLAALGLSDAHGRVKPSRQAKLRQVEEFLRLLDSTLDDAFTARALSPPTDARPLRIVDLGCGNAYLTFAAFAHLSDRLPLELTGVDVKEQARARNTELAQRLGWCERVRFVRSGIRDVRVHPSPDVVLALHACDTATDDALSRALTWGAPAVLAAPCCHHHVQTQLRGRPAPEPYGLLTRDGILRERLADTLTDAMRAALVREQGYRVDVVEFVGSHHTPRNTLLRAVRTGHASPQAVREYATLAEQWGATPALADLPREPASADLPREPA